MSIFRNWHSIPLHRRWVVEGMHLAWRNPSVAVESVVNVADAAAARAAASSRVSWVSIWVRALALASRKWPVLRTSYVSFPWPHLYVHPSMIAMVVIEREWDGVRAVFGAIVKNLDARSVHEIERETLVPLKTDPILSFSDFRRLILSVRLPFPLRRLVYSVAHGFSGAVRSELFGCTVVNPMGLPRTKNLHSSTPASFMFMPGKVQANGDVTIQLYWDHRLIDGRELDDMLREIESIMNKEIAAELISTQGDKAALVARSFEVDSSEA